MKISVIGCGYVGLVTSLGFASKNLKVTNIDLNKKKIREIERKKPHIYEPGLNKLLLNLHAAKSFSSNLLLT